MATARELVQSCTTVFTLPEIYIRVRDVTEDPQSTMDDLTNALRIDPAISARLLKMVNSPFYGFPGQVDTVSRAVSLIGMQGVSDLVTATTIGRTFSGMTPQLMDLSAFWRKSVLSALLASKVAKCCGVDDSERFFIEGLLRDIGHLVLYQTIPQRAQSALVEAGNLGTPLAEVEQSSIGCDYAEVGAELVRSWGMPVQIEQAVRHQLSPQDAGEYTLHAAIVHLAGVIVDQSESGQWKEGAAFAFDQPALSATQFQAGAAPALLAEAREQLQDTLAMIYPLALAA